MTEEMDRAPAQAGSDTDELAGWVHDLSNGLAVLRGALDLARAAATEGDRRRALGLAWLFLPKLRRLLAQAEVRQRPFDLAPAGNPSISEVVTQNLAVFRILLPDNIELYCNVPSGLWPVVVDSITVERIVTNLFANARDVMADGGILTVHLQNITAPPNPAAGPLPPGLRPGRYVRIMVADTGGGIPRQVQAQLFRNCVTTKPRGTGFGLMTAHRLVKESGGYIDFETSPRGTRFNVYLRASSPPPPK